MHAWAEQTDLVRAVRKVHARAAHARLVEPLQFFLGLRD